MSEFKGYRERSRTDWGSDNPSMSLEQINTGALLRIADATETIAKNYDALLRDRNYQRDRKDELLLENASLRRSVAALRGCLGRFKKKKK